MKRMKNGEPVALIDVGSANVRACLATPNAASVPVISRLRREDIQNASGESTHALPDLAVQALGRCLAGFNASPRPKRADVVLAAPWYKATVSAIASTFDKRERITESVVEKALREYREKNHAASPPGRVSVESVTTRTYVNGYPTTIAEPLRGSAIAIDYYESEADEPFLHRLEEEIHRIFPGLRIIFHSFLFAAFSALRSLREEKSFIVVDVGGEITDIAVARRGGLSFVGSFPSGARTLLRAVAGGGSFAAAASRATMFVRDESSDEDAAAFGALFKKAADGWNAEYRALLEQAALEAPVPHVTFLIADKEPIQWFSHALAAADAPFPAQPIAVSPDFFRNALLIGEGGSYDAFLSIAAIHALGARDR